uniref:Uncharacterized protein n=1 Tax=viral metagenome TaxID=1070528 RepID=A0A6C0HEM9_9ZZZZ
MGGFFSMERDSLTSGGANINTRGATAPRRNNSNLDPESPKNIIGATAPRRNNSNLDPESPKNIIGATAPRRNNSNLDPESPKTNMNLSKKEGHSLNNKMIAIKGGSRRKSRSMRRRKTNSRK